MSINEARNFLCMARSTIYKAINAGQIPTVKRGRRRLIVAADAAAYVERLREKSSIISA